MALKLDTNMAAVAHHIVDGPVTFPYAVDAQSAISRFPDEWSELPWSQQDAAAARQRMVERHAHEVEHAKASGLPVPKDLPPPPPEPTAEEQAAIMEHAQAVAEANERLKVAREKAAKKRPRKIRLPPTRRWSHRPRRAPIPMRRADRSAARASRRRPSSSRSRSATPRRRPTTRSWRKRPQPTGSPQPAPNTASEMNGTFYDQ